MLAEGIPPRSIAAVTFTELAASELHSRVREFVADLSGGHIATELRVALPDGLSQAQRDNLVTASAAIDEITCSLGEGRWLNIAPIDIGTLDTTARGERLAAVTTSWQDALHLRESRPAENGRSAVRGLRRPQVGALHAALAHVTRSTEPATIVMPTGTGKTETMLALNAHEQHERLLVVVPTDALREQIAGKFETFGVLKQQECLDASASFPVVMRLSHIPRTTAEVDQIFDSANVVVTTMQIAGRAEAPVQERMAARASALFIDEAHHIGAPTWARFRELFVERTPPLPIVQFTATPFREDGRRVDGEFIYTYPLKKAQAGGYFKPIRFEAVFGLDEADADQAIAEKLGEVLQADLTAGLNHLAMARCSTIDRAKGLHQLYSSLFPEFRPVIVHSEQPVRERRMSLAALARCESRIIV
ncbi:MAG: DEAD/DEAH box helicase family protein, partial [Bradyrhizobium sp.]